MADPLAILDAILSEHGNDAKWNDTRFGGIKILANTLVGKVGQQFTEQLCTTLKISWAPPTNAQGRRVNQSPWDLKISNIDFEIKTATADVSGNFQFNHIRYHRPYDALLCIGISPDDVMFDMWTKAEVATGKAGNLVSMERGANASYKLTKRPAELHSMNRFQSELLDIAANIEAQRRRRN
ncbi:MAG: hypothetical protein ACON31_04995 [Candidatus Puniceispirillaceae bacterium]